MTELLNIIETYLKEQQEHSTNISIDENLYNFFYNTDLTISKRNEVASSTNSTFTESNLTENKVASSTNSNLTENEVASSTNSTFTESNLTENKVASSTNSNLTENKVASLKVTNCKSLKELHEIISSCKACPRNTTRVNIPPLQESKSCKVMFIAPATTRQEELNNSYFHNKSYELFNRMIKAMNLSLNDIYLSNAIKCSSDNNIITDEAYTTCTSFLEQEISLVKPKTIVLMGETPAKMFLKNDKIATTRQIWHELCNIPCISTYSPNYLLRYPKYKKDTWLDLQLIMQKIF